MDQSDTPENRRSQRSNVLMTASVQSAHGKLDVKLRNLSEDGALVEGDTLPADGSRVVFSRGELIVEGQIVWVRGKRAGIAFDEKLSPEAVLRNITSRKPRPALLFGRPAIAAKSLSKDEPKIGSDRMWRPGLDLQSK